MQVLCFDFLFGNDEAAIKHAKVRNVVKNLQPIVLLVLDWVEAHVKFGKLRQMLDELQLKHFLNAVKSQGQEPQCLNRLEPAQLDNLIL